MFQNPAIDAGMVERGFEGEDDLLKAYFRIATKYKSEVPVKPDPTAHAKLRDIYAF